MSRKKRRKRPQVQLSQGDVTAPAETDQVEADSPIIFSVRVTRIAAWVVAICALCEVALWILDYHVNYGQLTELGPIRRMCNTAREDSLASWFGTTQTFLVAMTAAALFFLARQAGAPRWRWAGWMVLSIFLFYMAIDDGAEIHERMGSAFTSVHRDQVDASGELTAEAALLEKFPSYTWQIIYAPVFGGLGLFLVVFSMLELRTWKGRVLVLGTLTCFTLAVGLDFVEGLKEDHPLNLYTHIDQGTEFDAFARERFQRNGFDALRHFSESTEEVIEMFGMTLLWAAFLLHAPHLAPGFRVRLPLGSADTPAGRDGH